MGLLDFLGLGPKRVKNDNGENLIYLDRQGTKLQFRYFKKNGKLEGNFFSYYLNGTVCETLSFKNGLLHGECTEFSSAGQTIRIYEKYDEGYLIEKKVYFTGSNRGKIANEFKVKKGEFKEGKGRNAWFKTNFDFPKNI